MDLYNVRRKARKTNDNNLLRSNQCGYFWFGDESSLGWHHFVSEVNCISWDSKAVFSSIQIKEQERDS